MLQSHADANQSLVGCVTDGISHLSLPQSARILLLDDQASWCLQACSLWCNLEYASALRLQKSKFVSYMMRNTRGSMNGLILPIGLRGSGL